MEDYEAFEELVDARELEFDDEDQEIVEIEYIRVTNTKNRKDGLIGIVFPDLKSKHFNPEDVDIDDERKVVKMTRLAAVKRGFL